MDPHRDARSHKAGIVALCLQVLPLSVRIVCASPRVEVVVGRSGFAPVPGHKTGEVGTRWPMDSTPAVRDARQGQRETHSPPNRTSQSVLESERTPPINRVPQRFILASSGQMVIREVAHLLNCSPRHVRRMADTGKMPRPLKIGTLVLCSSRRITTR